MSGADTQERLQTLVNELPPELHEDVINYIESILPNKKAKNKYLMSNANPSSTRSRTHPIS